MTLTLLDLGLIAGMIFITVIWIRLVHLKLHMRRNKELLRREGIFPNGSTQCHGMVRSENGVEHDSKPARSWYSHLAG